MAKITISSELKTKIINDFKTGLKQKEICEKYNMNKSTICRIVKGFREKGTVDTLHLGGRPRKTSPLQDQLIVSELKKSSKIVYKDVVNNLKLDISSRSIYRRAKQAEKIPEKSLMFDTTRSLRLQFAKAHLHWSKENWRTAIMSTFNVAAQSQLKVKCPKSLENKTPYKKLKPNNEDSLVWGCYAPRSKATSKHVTINVDYKNILNDVRYAYVDKYVVLSWERLHTKTPNQACHLVNTWIVSNGVSVLNWPSQSTDLNPIEYLWKSMELNILTQNYSNRQELLDAIQLEWQKISMEAVENLIDSMPARCELVLNNSGYPTPFTNNLTDLADLETLEGDHAVKTESDDIESIIP